MEEKRRTGRVGYRAKSVIVVCDTQEKIFGDSVDLSAVGIAITVPGEIPDSLIGRDVIVMTETMIMYADVVRLEHRDDGTTLIGMGARRFKDDVIEFLFQRIVLEKD